MGSKVEDEYDKPLDIWDKYVNGDVTCFKKLFKLYYGQMYGYGLKLCGQPELVNDCIQELFKTIWERRHKLDHIDSPNVYLFVSFRRKILKKANATNKSESNLDETDENLIQVFGEEEIIITREEKKQQRKALAQALNQLSNRQREVVYLHFYHGMSYGEIEKIMDIKRQSVRNHMYRAMKALRTLLDDKIMKLVS